MAGKELHHVKHIRGSQAASDAYTGVEGEFTINRDSQSIRIHDNVTPGGHGTIYHARVDEIPSEQNIPKDWAIGCRVIAGPGTIGGSAIPAQFIEKMFFTGEINLYVATDGDDEKNNGLSPEFPVATLARAVSLSRFFVGATTININVGEGEFAGCTLYRANGSGTNGTVNIKGAGVDLTFFTSNLGNNRTSVAYGGFTVKLGTSASAFTATRTGVSVVRNVRIFGTPNSGAMFSADSGGIFEVGDNVTIDNVVPAKSGDIILFRVGGNSLLTLTSSAYTVSGKFTCVDCSNGGLLTMTSNKTAFTGDVIGKRYTVSKFGRIYTGGKGENFFPGTIDGEVVDQTAVYY